MQNTLLLASSSQSRKMLLTEAGIPFTCIQQHADESKCDVNLPFQQLIEQIALYKMEQAIMPADIEGEHAFVLTADTMSQGVDGAVSGKPASRADAIAAIKKAQQGLITTGTAFVLDRKIYRNGTWQVDERIIGYVAAQCEFYVPDHWIERYLDHSPALRASGSIAIEGYGSQFLKSVHGSYTAIVGLPLFQVRQALDQLGFRF